MTEFFNYFNAMTEDRRKNPRDDVASVIANATIDGKPIGHLEAISYYIIVATAGHDTTSSTAAVEAASPALFDEAQGGVRVEGRNFSHRHCCASSLIR